MPDSVAVAARTARSAPACWQLAAGQHEADLVVRAGAVRLADQHAGGRAVQVHAAVVLDGVDGGVVDELEQARRHAAGMNGVNRGAERL